MADYDYIVIAITGLSERGSVMFSWPVTWNIWAEILP